MYSFLPFLRGFTFFFYLETLSSVDSNVFFENDFSSLLLVKKTCVDFTLSITLFSFLCLSFHIRELTIESRKIKKEEEES
jgi:hypothetical protein